MDDIKNAILILVIVIFITIYISILHSKQTKQNSEKPQIESFTTYQDVKTKTLNWCNKMKKVGLLSPEQFDECVATFKDATTGILPKEFKVPDTGMPRNFSLYDTRSKTLTPNLTGENTNTVMLVSNTGMYMACNTDNVVYFKKNINDSSVNQQDLYFTLIPQANDVYNIMSPYGKYLIATGPESGPTVSSGSIVTKGQDWCASFSGTSVGTMASWNINKSENNKVSFESMQYNNFFLSSSMNEQDNTLIITYGTDDSMIWQMFPKATTNASTEATNSDSAAYLVAKENVLTNLTIVKAKKISLQAIIDSLTKLQDMVRTNYVNIQNHAEQILNNMDVSANDNNSVINNIINMKNYYLQQIEGEISEINIQLTKVVKTEATVENDFETYMNKISSDLATLTSQIEQNQLIMDRQTNNYDKLNSDFSYINTKKDKIESIDKSSNLNIDLIKTYNSNNSMLNKIYPVIIVIIFLLMLYLAYLTYLKFMSNVYHHYL